MWQRLARAALAVASLTLIGFGASSAYWPAGFVAVGLLIWIDLSREGRSG